MTSEKIVHSHQLVITITQDENADVYWKVLPDSAVDSTRDASYEELAEAGAPLAALGTRVLFDLLSEELISIALDKANNHIWQKQLIQLRQLMTAETPALEDGSIAEEGEAMVIH